VAASFTPTHGVARGFFPINRMNAPEPPTAGTDLPGEDPSRRVREVPWLKYALLWPLWLLARGWTATLRLRISAEERAWLSDTRTPLVIVMWHNRLFIADLLYRRYRQRRRLATLVSASRDGAWLAAYFRLAGLHPVRGSSSWRGAAAAKGLLAELQNGADAALTPDGPRGPCYEIKPGALLVARHEQTPMLLVSARFARAWRLRGWDGF
jgi:lysophospholipid acyltransferase (LPLAT)-like uncharacterized protein